jgi:cystathionine beta-lyase/cystathionine gamma-synthase
MQDQDRDHQFSALLTRALQDGEAVKPLATVSPPIVQSTIYELDDAAHGARLSEATAPPDFYTRWGNPTTRQAETILATLERGEACLVTSSGMGAISGSVIAFLSAGDHVVAGRALYAGTTELFTSGTPAPRRLKPSPVTESEPSVMPWKAFVKLRMLSRPVSLRASLSALSTALVPVGPGNWTL